MDNVKKNHNSDFGGFLTHDSGHTNGQNLMKKNVNITNAKKHFQYLVESSKNIIIE